MKCRKDRIALRQSAVTCILILLLYCTVYDALLDYLYHAMFICVYAAHVLLCSYCPVHAASGDCAETKLNSQKNLHSRTQWKSK